MPRQRKERLVHFDIDSLAQQTMPKEQEQITSLGQTLRGKREKKKLSIEDVAKKLCIKEVYIRALEDGHYYAFPSRVYGIGFLRSYAKFLGLDSDMMVAQFHAETSDVKEAPLDMPIIEKHFALPSKKTLGFVALIILAIIIIWFTVAAILNADLFNKINPEITPQDTEEIVTTEEQAPLIADETPTQEEKKEAVETKPEQEPVQEKEISEKALQAEVAFIAKKDVWVRLYNTETQKVILEKVLKKNDSFIPESKLSVLELTTGRGNLLDLYKNGQKVKTFGHEKSRSLAEFADTQD